MSDPRTPSDIGQSRRWCPKGVRGGLSEVGAVSSSDTSDTSDTAGGAGGGRLGQCPTRLGQSDKFRSSDTPRTPPLGQFFGHLGQCSRRFMRPYPRCWSLYTGSCRASRVIPSKQVRREEKSAWEVSPRTPTRGAGRSSKVRGLARSRPQLHSHKFGATCTKS